MAADKIKFDESLHRYTLNGVAIPSVTSILNPIKNDFRFVTDQQLLVARDRGIQTHDIIEKHCAKKVDYDLLGDDGIVTLMAWEQFLETSKIKIALSEKIVYSSVHGYCGRLDLFAHSGQRNFMIDTKETSVVPHQAGPQTYAYSGALAESYPQLLLGDKSIERFVLHMQKGRFKLVPMKEDSLDRQIFHSCLNIHKYNQRYLK